MVAKSSTVAELLALSDGSDYVMWVKRFLEAQGYRMKPAIVHQDNQSTIFLATKGRTTGQKTRHIDIRYFAVKDLEQLGRIRIVYTQTEEMLADVFTKTRKIVCVHAC